MKRKWILILLLCCFIMGSVHPMIPLHRVEAAKNEERSLPKKGEVLNGFQVTNVSYDTISKTHQISLTHQKSGARMLILKNDSKNRGFSVSFNTPAQNNKGINHILEHTIVGGSEKYPSRNLIFDLSNATYTSEVNAYTYQNMTVYPVCSESEDQLLKLTDIYMSSVYQPLFAKDKKVFEREAWRYTLENSDSPIVATGVVYNEMKGVFGNINNVAYYNGQKSIFPDINQSNISGGFPESILTLSYEELVKFYKENYHPSNSFMVLYGDVDYLPFLKLLDQDYLSSYRKKDFTILHTKQKQFTQLVEKDYEFPVSKDSNTKNKSVIEVVFALPDIKKLGVEQATGFSLLSYMLNMEHSNLKKALIESKVGETYSISTGLDTYQPTFRITAYDADRAKKKQFYNIIQKELKALVKNGVDKELAKSVFTSLKFDKVLGSENQSPSQKLLNASLYQNIFDDPTVNLYAHYQSIQEKLDSGYFENLVDSYLLKNAHTALVTTNPKPGLLEKQETSLAKQLENKKSGMTEDEIAKLVKSTKKFNSWNQESTSKEVLSSMNVLAAKDLPIELKEYKVSDTKKKGYREIIANADVTEVGELGFLFDGSHLKKEELHYLKFYADLIASSMPTKKYKEEEVVNKIVSQTNSLSFEVTGFDREPVWKVKLYSLDEDYGENLSLIQEILMKSDLNQLSVYGKRTIANIKMGYQQTFAEPLNFILIRSLANANETYQLMNYLTGLDYYHFILSLEKELEVDEKAVIQKIEKIRNKMFGKSNLTVLFAGGKQSQKQYLQELPNFITKLSDKQYKKATYTLPLPEKKEAFITNTSVQYMVASTGLKENDITYHGRQKVVSSLLTNLLLIPEIRLKGGAYGAEATFLEKAYFAYTYRDSNFVQSLTTIQASGEFLNQISPMLTQEDLDNYIISTFATANLSQSELAGASSRMYDQYLYYGAKDTKKFLNQIKNTTLKDIKEMVTELNQLEENLNYIVVAPESMIMQHKGLFDTVTPLN